MPINVLLVDDSAVMRAMISRTLRLSGIPLGEIVGCGNGFDALEMLRLRKIDIALIDINMPMMDGEELLRRLRANPETAKLPVVVVSTEGSAERVSRLKQMGASFVHKPFAPETIRDTIYAVTGVPHECNAGAAAAAGNGLDF